MAIKSLDVKIKCNGIKPSKREVFTLAAELVDMWGEEFEINSYYDAIMSALKSYDYDYDYDYDYYYYYYDYGYSYKEKVLALLFLAQIIPE